MPSKRHDEVVKDAESKEQAPRRLLGRYRDMAAVGRGGMGTVYRAFDEELQRIVALKVIQSRLVSHGEARKRFEREVRSMASVDHRCVVRVYDFHQDARSAIIAMEFVEGRSLKSILKEGALEVGRAVELCAQLTEALVAVHEAGVVHRDLKPANVMVTAGDEVKLMDFGLVRFEDDREKTALTRSGQIVGTLRYLPPEVYGGRPADLQGDLFQLGLIFFECLAGTLPLRGRALSDMIDGSAYRDLLAAVADDPIPREWRALLTSLLSFSPAGRPSTGKSVLAAFRGGGDISAPRPAGAVEAPEPAARPVEERDPPHGAAGPQLADGRRRDAARSSRGRGKAASDRLEAVSAERGPGGGRRGRPARPLALAVLTALIGGAIWFSMRPPEGATELLALERIPGFTSLLLRWRSNAPSSSMVEYGRAQGDRLVQARRVISPSGQMQLEHRMILPNLGPAAKGAFRIRLAPGRFSSLYGYSLPDEGDPILTRKWLSAEELELTLSFPVAVRLTALKLAGEQAVLPQLPDGSKKHHSLQFRLPSQGEWTELHVEALSEADEKRAWQLPIEVFGLEKALLRVGDRLGPAMENPVKTCVERLFARAREIRSNERVRFEALLAGNGFEAGDGLGRIGPRRRAEVLLNREHRGDFLPVVDSLDGLVALRAFMERCPDPFATESLSSASRLKFYRALGPLFVLDRAMEHLLAEAPIDLPALCGSYVSLERREARDYADDCRTLSIAPKKGPAWVLPLFEHREGWEYFRVANRHFGGAMTFMGLMDSESGPMKVFEGFRPDRVRDEAKGSFLIPSEAEAEAGLPWELWLGGCNLPPSGWIELRLQGPFDELPLPVRFYNDSRSFLGAQTPATEKKRMRKRFIVARLPASLLCAGRWNWQLVVSTCRNSIAGLTVAELAFLKRGVAPDRPRTSR